MTSVTRTWPAEKSHSQNFPDPVFTGVQLQAIVKVLVTYVKISLVAHLEWVHGMDFQWLGHLRHRKAMTRMHLQMLVAQITFHRNVTRPCRRWRSGLRSEWHTGDRISAAQPTQPQNDKQKPSQFCLSYFFLLSFFLQILVWILYRLYHHPIRLWKFWKWIWHFYRLKQSFIYLMERWREHKHLITPPKPQ